MYDIPVSFLVISWLLTEGGNSQPRPTSRGKMLKQAEPGGSLKSSYAAALCFVNLILRFLGFKQGNDQSLCSPCIEHLTVEHFTLI